MPSGSTLVIATRESRLALWQAEHVKSLLEQRGHSVQLLGMTTRGDQILDRTLSKVGGKGLFVKELELALEEGRADIAVHSLKDVPMDLPDGFELACVMEREDPRDAFVSPRYATLAELPVLPQAHAGRHQTLLWRRDLGPDRQATLRLWRSGYRTERGEPIWIGMLAQQRQRDLLGLLHVPMTLSAPPDSTALLLPLPRMEKRRVGDGLWLLRPAPAPESPPPPAP